jgi:nucleoside-diphosphate-sugar epimerase
VAVEHGILGARLAPERRVPHPPLLVFGLTGQLGEALLRRGLPMPALALSRAERRDAPGLAWRRGALADFVETKPFEAVLSLGPLDAFAAAVAEGRVRAGRVVAFGSTSVHAKADSPDAAERALAARLAAAEDALLAACRQRGTPCLVLRPTLVWGMGRDATLSRVVGFARRCPLLPLPLGAPGLRQPVHALDLADAARAALALASPPALAVDLPGGDRLPFGAMLGRAVAAGAPACRVLPLPWRGVQALAGRQAALRGLASRLDVDLVFPSGPAAALLGWSPRGFAPTAADFPAP